jgi:hypothetical protein
MSGAPEESNNYVAVLFLPLVPVFRMFEDIGEALRDD